MNRYMIVKYHELALKGKNRPLYVKQLAENLRAATRGAGVRRVWHGHSMLGLTLHKDADPAEVGARVRDCFGVARYFLAQRLPRDLDAVEELLAAAVPDLRADTFRVTAKRSDKDFPATSYDINNRLGDYVRSLTDWRVKLKGADLNIHVDVLPKEILVYFHDSKGHGGLPVGVSGRAVCMLSGGIDSPVAAWNIMKRGCVVEYIHFHSYPLVDTSSIDKAVELVEHLTRYQGRSTLHLVPFSAVQQRIIVTSPPKSRVILYRRLMMRIAERIAEQTRALALVTGDSLGQVASQTLQNLAAVEAVASMPVLRPLIGSNKQEIIDTAREIGTYEVSIQPDQDCCSLFVPKSPETRSSPARAAWLEESLPVEEMVEEALAGVETREFAFP